MGDLDRVRFGGEIVDRRTSNMLREAQRIANEKDPSIGKLHLSQGCFCNDVAASAGTHSGAGAFDLSVRGYSEHQKEIIALSLRKVGFASWRRMPNQGPWPEHIHGIAMGSKDLASGARAQVRNYLDGETGLVGHRADNQPRPGTILTWEQYKDKYLDGQNSYHAGAAGETAATTDPVPTSSTSTVADPYDITAGTGVATSQDSDNDGLTDQFERLIRTNPLSADSDGDGITDGQAFVATGGRGTGMTVDANHDGVADWLEATVGQQSALAGTSTGSRITGTGIGTGITGSGIGTGISTGGGIGAETGIGQLGPTGTTPGLPAGATGLGTESLEGSATDAIGG